jgi:hypothetical protein
VLVREKVFERLLCLPDRDQFASGAFCDVQYAFDVRLVCALGNASARVLADVGRTVKRRSQLFRAYVCDSDLKPDLAIPARQQLVQFA